jgi:hypothetical protein
MVSYEMLGGLGGCWLLVSLVVGNRAR